MTVPFEKVHACGNDFLLLEAPLVTPELAKICDRHHGIGADGVFVYQGSENGVILLDHYDPDGSQSFCINGTRAVLAVLNQKAGIPSQGQVNCAGVVLAFREVTDLVLPKMPVHPYTHEDLALNGYYVHVGNPHVIFFEGIQEDHFRTIAPKIRDDPKLTDGANVHLVQKEGEQHRIRSYERGVEDFTLACGSGIYAAALALLGQSNSQTISFQPDGFGQVMVAVTKDHLIMSGPTNWVASGVWRC